jgi:hypothetical protein
MEILLKYLIEEEMNGVELTHIRERLEKIGCCHGIVGDWGMGGDWLNFCFESHAWCYVSLKCL